MSKNHLIVLSTLGDVQVRLGDIKKRWTLKLEDLNSVKTDKKSHLLARFEQKNDVWKTEVEVQGTPVQYTLKSSLI